MPSRLDTGAGYKTQRWTAYRNYTPLRGRSLEMTSQDDYISCAGGSLNMARLKLPIRIVHVSGNS